MRGPLSCSQSVLCAFCDDAKLTEIGAPYSGGRKIKCGALCAAEIVLSAVDGNDSRHADFENKFCEKIGAINCRDIRSKNLAPCIGCVETSAKILDDMIH